MPLTSADVKPVLEAGKSLKDAQAARNAALLAVARKTGDPSVCVVTHPDGTYTALVRLAGNFDEVTDVTFIDMRAQP